MNDPNVGFNYLIAALEGKNFHLTPQRIELVRMIAIRDGHPSANQFYEQIELKFPTMNHTTVYKNKKE